MLADLFDFLNNPAGYIVRVENDAIAIVPVRSFWEANTALPPQPLAISQSDS